LRVSWTAQKTNEEVLKAAEVEIILHASIKVAKMTYFGHSLRKKGNCLEKEITHGATPASRARGSPKKIVTWLDNIKTWTGRPVAHLFRTVGDREKWFKIVGNASNPRPEDG